MGQITRRALGRMAGAGLAVSASRRAVAAAVATPFDPTPYVHPELRPYLAAVRQFTGGRALTLENPPLERKANFATPIKPAPAWAERVVPGPAGGPDVRVYVINAGAPSGALKPAILQIHGGGFVLGGARQQIGDNQILASTLDCVVVSVEYRLAPETRFPGALEDNYAALKWLHEHADELGVDRARIAVMGESAGGGHAAMLAIAARDRGEIPLSTRR